VAGSPRLPLELHELFRIRGVLDPSAAVPGLRASMSAALVAGLIADGWVERAPHPDGNRSAWLTLTPAGRAVTDQLLGAMRARHERILAALSPAELRAAELAVPALIRALRAELNSQQEPASQPS
jgi:DNA-binding MarR family transcriptional regulator